MKKILSGILATLIIALSVFALFSCAPQPTIPEDLDLSGITMADATVTYDGEAHSLSISGTLPENVTVTYEGNAKVEVGTYTVIAKFYYLDEYIEDSDLTATLTIEEPAADPEPDPEPEPEPEIDLSGINFSNSTVTYNGEAQSLAISGTLPEGVTVKYEGNEKVDAGNYTVIAKFYYNNEHLADLDKTATLTIKPARLNVTVDDYEAEVGFNGKVQEPDLLIWEGEIPKDVEVVVESTIDRYVGTYLITYKFVINGNPDNYENKEDISIVVYIVDNPEYGTEGLLYGENADGSYHVAGYTGTDTEVVIPAVYNGQAVTAVAYGAFDGRTDITYIHVPKSVKAIGQAAFRGCTSLEAITLPFVGGSHNSSNEYFGYVFGASGYVGNTQFVPKSLKLVRLDGIERVPAYSFWGCTSIEEVVILSGNEIGINAFRGCSSLAKVTIAKSVTVIQGAAAIYSPFIDCSKDLVIHLASTSVPAGFTSTWNVIDTEGNVAEVVTK